MTSTPAAGPVWMPSAGTLTDLVLLTECCWSYRRSANNSGRVIAPNDNTSRADPGKRPAPGKRPRPDKRPAPTSVPSPGKRPIPGRCPIPRQTPPPPPHPGQAACSHYQQTSALCNAPVGTSLRRLVSVCADSRSLARCFARRKRRDPCRAMADTRRLSTVGHFRNTGAAGISVFQTGEKST